MIKIADLVKLTQELIQALPSIDSMDAEFYASYVGLGADIEIKRLIRLMNKTKESRKKKKLNKRIVNLIVDTLIQEVK